MKRIFRAFSLLAALLLMGCATSQTAYDQPPLYKKWDYSLAPGMIRLMQKEKDSPTTSPLRLGSLIVASQAR